MTLSSNPIRHYWEWIKLLHQISSKYSVIVLNSFGMGYIFPIFAARLFGIPIRIVHSHTSSFSKNTGRIKKIIIQINNIIMKWSSTNFFACSKNAGEWMFGKHIFFKVVPNSIEISKFVYQPLIREKVRENLKIQNKFVIGHVGFFSYPKNQPFVVDVFNEYHKKNKKSILLLIGKGKVEHEYYLNITKKKVEAYGLENTVKFLGLRKDIPELMQAMDCFILPSYYEGFPVVSLEAQAAGLPCWFSDTITKEVAITNLVHYMSLNKSPAEWAEEIYSDERMHRKDMSDEIKKAGYDINESIKCLEKYYMGRH